MKATFLVSTLCFCAAGSYLSWNKFPQVREKAEEILNTSTFQTLEVRYNADSIMEMHKKELLKDPTHTFLEPTMLFVPYLFMDVKYSKSQDKTGEGIILWSLLDGEMVINTSTWERTHGFTDCMASNATKQEFQIINALASKGGSWDREGLSKFLNLENHSLDTWLDSCRRKNLIVQKGNSYRLHLENPKIQVIPETKLQHFLVTKPTKHAQRVNRRYRPAQVELIAKAAFGNDFAIRKTLEIFLPVYSIVVQNPDGTQMISYWNALNGKQYIPPYDFE